MRYKFRVGDLIITGDHHEYPDHRGILMERFERHGNMVWKIHWLNGAPVCFGAPDTEMEINLFNLRRRYYYYNKEGEYYESKD